MAFEYALVSGPYRRQGESVLDMPDGWGVSVPGAEYREISTRQLWAEFNRLGSTGWELTTCAATSNNGYQDIWYWFRRRVSDTSPV
jgi:hypothetical protein